MAKKVQKQVENISVKMEKKVISIEELFLKRQNVFTLFLFQMRWIHFQLIFICWQMCQNSSVSRKSFIPLVFFLSVKNVVDENDDTYASTILSH